LPSEFDPRHPFDGCPNGLVDPALLIEHLDAIDRERGDLRTRHIAGTTVGHVVPVSTIAWPALGDAVGVGELVTVRSRSSRSAEKST